MRHINLRLPSLAPELHVQGYSCQEPDALLRTLSHSIRHAGGWVLQTKQLPTGEQEMQIELQSRGMMEIYSALLASGVELTRAGHVAMANSCSVLHRLPIRWHQIASIHLTIAFLARVDVGHLLQPPKASA